MSSKVQQLQVLQQNLQTLSLQKQQLESTLMELESAATELQTTPQAYKIVGKIMVSSSAEKLLQEVQEKKEVLELRFKNVLQQEEKVKKNVDKLQQEVIQELQKK